MLIFKFKINKHEHAEFYKRYKSLKTNNYFKLLSDETIDVQIPLRVELDKLNWRLAFYLVDLSEYVGQKVKTDKVLIFDPTGKLTYILTKEELEEGLKNGGDLK